MFEEQIKELCKMMDNLIDKFLNVALDADTIEAMRPEDVELMKDSIKLIKVSEKISIQQAAAQDKMIANQEKILKLLEEK